MTAYGTPHARFIKKMAFKLSETISKPRLTRSDSAIPTASFSEPTCYQFLMEKEEMELFTAAIEKLQGQSYTPFLQLRTI